MEGKTCKTCQERKALTDFPKETRNKDGRAGRCKDCCKLFPSNQPSVRKEYMREYHARNRERLNERSRKYHKENSKAISLRSRKYRKENKSKIAERGREWYRNNKDKRKVYHASWYLENREKVKARSKAYYEINKEKVFAYCRERARTCPNLKSRRLMYRLLRKTLEKSSGGKSGRTYEVLGYSPAHLKARIECQFSAGMSWENYGEWHVDHKIPVSHFLSKGETRSHVINALCNLQPLWAEDNMEKGSRHPLRGAEP